MYNNVQIVKLNFSCTDKSYTLKMFSSVSCMEKITLTSHTNISAVISSTAEEYLWPALLFWLGEHSLWDRRLSCQKKTQQNIFLYSFFPASTLFLFNLITS